MIAHPLVTLGSLTKIRTGKLDANASSENGEYPFFTCARKPLRICSYTYDCECILVAGNGDLNVKHYKGKFDAYQRTYIIEAVDSSGNELHLRYLYHFMERYLETLREQSIGGIIKYIKLANLTDVKIPLPPLCEQKRIAGILDAADALRAQRREALAQLDTLLQSTFLDLFGDPVTNPKGWEEYPLDHVAKVSTGNTPPSKLEGMFNGDIPFVTPGDLKETWVQTKRTVTKSGAESSRTVTKGATFVCCIGATIGKMGKAVKTSAFNQQINAIEWKPEVVVPDFGLEMMRFFKAKIAKDGASTTLPILKKSLFQKIQVPIPPLPLQQRFAAIVEQVESQKARMRTQLTELDTLFAALQQRAFNGEL